MKKFFDRRTLRTRDRKRLSPSEYQSQLEYLRNLSKWLLFIPVVMLILFSCGQLGILTSQKLGEANTQSNMKAYYGPWTYVLIHAVKPEILEEIVRDYQSESGDGAMIPEKIESENPWVAPSPKPTSVTIIVPTAYFSPISPGESPTSIETLIASDTPTQGTPPPPTSMTIQTTTASPNSPTNTATTIPTIPSLPTATATHTSVSAIPNTYWFANTRLLNGYALVSIRPNGNSTSGGNFLKYFSETIPEGAVMEGGKCTVSYYATNSSSNDQQIGIVLSLETSGRFALAGTTDFIPSNIATPTLFTKSFSILPYTFVQSDRLTLSFSVTSSISLYWDGEWNDAGLVVPPISP